MEHPQPAFDLLTSLPVDERVEDYIFVDWFVDEKLDATRGDNIADHPEAWDVLELPEALAELTADDYVTLRKFDGKLNLNAIAIGLGFEDISYEPEKFAGIVYHPSDPEATGFLFGIAAILSVGESPVDTSNTVQQTINRLEELGLLEDAEFHEDAYTAQVSDLI